MRNFEERKAEIFRRSNERMKKRRRNRDCLLMCCISLVLCIAVYFSVTISPADLEEAIIMPEHTHNIGIRSEYISVEIQSKNGADSYYQKMEDRNAVAAIAKKLCDTDDKSAAQENCGEIKGTGYQIILTASDGGKTIYTLRGNKLTDETNVQSRILTDDQVTELRTLLGLSK